MHGHFSARLLSSHPATTAGGRRGGLPYPGIRSEVRPSLSLRWHSEIAAQAQNHAQHTQKPQHAHCAWVRGRLRVSLRALSPASSVRLWHSACELLTEGFPCSNSSMDMHGGHPGNKPCHKKPTKTCADCRHWCYQSGVRRRLHHNAQLPCTALSECITPIVHGLP